MNEEIIEKNLLALIFIFKFSFVNQMRAHTPNAIIAMNYRIIRYSIIAFIVSSVVGYLIHTIIYVMEKQNFLLPPLEKQTVWNILFFTIFIYYAKYLAKPKYERRTGKLIPQNELYNSTLMYLLLVSVIVQCIAFITPKAFYLFSFIIIQKIFNLVKVLIF
ncbi:hypothetical protein TRFO_37774 [Tritrichomonas foetus]|uniref:Uncharacterized protein n=1 Tax=Tritrichomonas foetus TaxID=1144522 RepID=A0A1J4JA97_9EUKA|nr:hypothetical protein TRFO_37774 [Tritrichomonas foetus]|eukprot:OHS96102.1 hypothetical protein TRFO_37774 [Tritrichomonas foetus]